MHGLAHGAHARIVRRLSRNLGTDAGGIAGGDRNERFHSSRSSQSATTFGLALRTRAPRAPDRPPHARARCAPHRTTRRASRAAPRDPRWRACTRSAPLAMMPTSRSSDPSERSWTARRLRSSAGVPLPSVRLRARWIRLTGSVLRAVSWRMRCAASRASVRSSDCDSSARPMLPSASRSRARASCSE